MTSGFFDRLKAGADVVADMTKRGAEEIQVRRKLSQLYDDAGRKAVELVRSGTISQPELDDLSRQIGDLEAQLDALKQHGDTGSAEDPGPAEDSGPAEAG
jgi:hypothetical protein